MKTITPKTVLFDLMAFFVFAAVLLVAMAGCGGGGGGSETTPPPVLAGVFVDSPVEGVRYETDTQAGFTDAAGRFHYIDGETITFQIGDITLGSALARDFMTPVHLVDGAVDETHPVVTNMARFLQSLDADGNPGNGITITQEIRNEIMGRQISFHLSISDFETLPDMTALFDSLNAMGLFFHGEQHLISVEQAWRHLREHMLPWDDLGDLVLMGVFGSGPVEGLYYETDTLAGFTNFEGMFFYREGEEIAFFIGDTLLGHATARAFMTLFDLVAEDLDDTDPMVINMARFLLSLDVDGDTDNGITITPEIEAGTFGWQIDFDFSMMNFENHPDMTSLMLHLNDMDLFFDGPHMLVPVEEALDFMGGYMWDYMGFGMIGEAGL